MVVFIERYRMVGRVSAEGFEAFILKKWRREKHAEGQWFCTEASRYQNNLSPVID
jgi:hypothetical protein